MIYPLVLLNISSSSLKNMHMLNTFTHIVQELSDHTSEVSVQHDVLDGMFTFYDSMTAKLNIHQVLIVPISHLFLMCKIILPIVPHRLLAWLLILFSF